MNLFISHSSKDSKTANEICELLEKSGNKCFLAPRDIRSGHEYAEEIINGIDNSDIMILLLSKASDSSPHVLREIERAVSKKLPIIVYKLEEVTLSKSMEYFLMTHQWVSEKPKAGYNELLTCINGFYNEKSDSGVKADISTGRKKADKSFIIKVVSMSAAAAVLIIAAVLVFGAVSKPVSVLGEGIDITEGTTPNETVTSAIDGITTTSAAAMEESGTPAAAENITDTENMNTTKTPQTSAETFSDVPTDTELPKTENEPAEEQTTNVTVEPAEERTTNMTEEPAGEQTANITDEEAASTAAVASAVTAELGDTVILGEYLGEPIKWRIIGLEEDGKTALVIADNVLTMKCFDAAEGGKYNSYDGTDYWRTAPKDMDKETEKLVRGDNAWESSNLRAWLNSDRDNVEYSGQEPNGQAMSEKKNGYNTEAGFLRSFSKTEAAAVLTSSVETNGVTTEDKVFLLSTDELHLLDEADVSTYAVPTESAAKQDQSGWYKLNINEYSINDHYWWLRDPDLTTGSQVYLVNISYAGDKVISRSAGLEGYGVRPVMRIDLTAECIEIK